MLLSSNGCQSAKRSPCRSPAIVVHFALLLLLHVCRSNGRFVRFESEFLQKRRPAPTAPFARADTARSPLATSVQSMSADQSRCSFQQTCDGADQRPRSAHAAALLEIAHRVCWLSTQQQQHASK